MTQNLYSKVLSLFSSGVSRPSRYQIQFSLPRGVGFDADDILPDRQVLNGQIQLNDNSFNKGQAINIKCFNAQFPQRNLLTSEKLQNSSPFRVPYSAGSYDAVQFSFYTSSRLDTRRYFDIWQNAVVNVRSNTMNYYNEFTSDIYMWMLDTAGRRTYGVRLEQAYPVSLGAVNVGYQMANSLTQVTATLQFRRWQQIGMDDANAKNTLDSPLQPAAE